MYDWQAALAARQRARQSDWPAPPPPLALLGTDGASGRLWLPRVAGPIQVPLVPEPQALVAATVGAVSVAAVTSLQQQVTELRAALNMEIVIRNALAARLAAAGLLL